MKHWDESFVTLLINAKSSQEFLAPFFNSGASERVSPKPLSYQAFSQKAGYSTKSYVAEIIAGRKKLTQASIEKFCKGLNLSALWKDYLENLVILENVQDADLKKTTLDQQDKIIIKILSARTKLQDSRSSLEKVLLKSYFPEICAALGGPEEGSTIEQIEKRTQIPHLEIQKTLDILEEENILTKRKDNYILRTQSLDLEFLNSPEHFKFDFIRSLEKAKNRFNKQSPTKSALFMTQTFSVQSSKLPYFKSKLEKLILEFAEQAEDYDGDTVADINISFTHS